jgi:hypothetical protein
MLCERGAHARPAARSDGHHAARRHRVAARPFFSHQTERFDLRLDTGCGSSGRSRGFVEAECEGEEFGLEGTKSSLQEAPLTSSAPELCLTILRAVQQFAQTAPKHNDVTALALVRSAPILLSKVLPS